MIVVFGCFSIAKDVLTFWKRDDSSKKETDLYTEVQAEIAAENHIKKAVENQNKLQELTNR